MRALVVVALALGVPALQPDAARVLADMRQALGGDAAIASVKALSVSGFETRRIEGSPTTTNIEWAVVLPDSFVRVLRMEMPSGIDIVTDGFRGDAPIYRRQSALPYPESLVQGATPAERAAHEAVVVRQRKRDFSRLALALIGPSAIDPLDVSYQGQESVAGRPCDLLQLRASDGYTATLAVDAATHLPVSVSWMAPAPILTSTTAATTTIGSPRGSQAAGAPPKLTVLPPTRSQTADMNPVEHRIFFEDFKAAGGLNWPHRFTEKVAERVWKTTRIGKYKLNPKIDPKLFDPARR